jgi:8-oxo-dGTP diphosphatase
MSNLSYFRYTLCFLTRGDQILMLHRLKAPNQGLWNGVGGRLELGETPQACMLREVYEETGYQVASLNYAGMLTWEGFEIPPGGLYIFTAEAPAGEPHLCSEGTLEWKSRSWVFTSPAVVSNIHVFGPLVFSGCPPKEYHFMYEDGQIASFEIRPLSASMVVG